MNSSKIACTGQASTQYAQSMQSSGLIKYWSASSLVCIQSTGHTSKHEASLTPTHGSVITKAICTSPDCHY